jgi:pimeloyl-ACP methyl ester carboxylesterase
MAGKAAAYSPAGLEFARALLASKPDSPVRRIIKAKGLEGRIRRIASENLAQGIYFAKLTLADWKSWNGKPFRLCQDGAVVYGNSIEPPARGFPLEYRNIMVTCNDVSRFTLDIDVPFELKIGRGAFTTPQQLRYDEQYGVEQRGDVFYSLRGNTTNPTKMLVTFPGFGPSTTRISYAVSYLKDLTDDDLNDTLMVCFQDRYLAAGSYMMVDNAGRPLYERVRDAIEGLRSSFAIDRDRMLFFGASKGGAIAIQYALEYPEAVLLLAVPQMNLPYYFTKPAFKDNLFRHDVLRELEQPEVRLRQYFDEGRRIHYFYTNSDESSNHSLIELTSDVPHLVKYRIDGQHSDVARAALPAMLGLIRQFLHGRADKEFTCEELRTFRHTGNVQVQVRVDPAASKVSGANWFIQGQAGRTRFLQLMTEHSYDFVKYTTSEQSLFPAYDPIVELEHVLAIEPNGTTWTGPLPARVNPGSRITRQQLTNSARSLDASTVQEYVVLEGESFGRYKYRWHSRARGADTLEMHVVTELGDLASPLDGGHRERPVYSVEVQPIEGCNLADLFALRLLVATGARRLHVVVHGDSLKAVLETLAAMAWEDVTVELQDSGAVLARAGEQ